MKTLASSIKDLLKEGCVIPAHPLALDHNRKLDIERQKVLTRYYIDSGAGGIAVGVHTTQFEIRNEKYGLYQPVLEIAAEEISRRKLSRPFIKVAGIVGPTEQALKEADIAVKNGYDLGLVSMGGLTQWSEEDLIERIIAIAGVIPVFGFYLQPAVGGKILSYEFWKEFAEIKNVHAIKIAPFNRYQTLDVVRAVCNSSRFKDICLYTGNDDNIVADLLTTYRFKVGNEIREKSIAGGLLGHWAVWTHKAVLLLDEIKEIKRSGNTETAELLAHGISITDANAAFFDAANNFKGCIAGIHEVLRRQGILKGTWCLDPGEVLSPGQEQEISRVYREYPDLNDDEFVKNHLNHWISE